MECITQLYRLPCTKNRLLTRKCPFRTHSNLCKHLCHAVTGIKIIVYHQCLKTFQRWDLLYTMMLRLDPQRQSYNKFRTFALFCLNPNISAHHIHNILGNGHTQSCTLSPADCGTSLTLKRRKKFLYKFLTHTDSVILYPDLI